MNILKKLSKDSRGFGHIEMIVIVLVVAAIAASGFFVYQHQKKHTTAHAGGWSTLVWYAYQNNRFTIQACYTPVHAFGGLVDQVKVAVINNGRTNIGSFTVYDTNYGGQSQSTTFNVGTQPWAFAPVINSVPTNGDAVIINSRINTQILSTSHESFGTPVYVPLVFNGNSEKQGGQTPLSTC